MCSRIMFDWDDENVLELKNAYLKCLQKGRTDEFPNMFQNTFIYDKTINIPDRRENILVIDFGGSSLKFCLYEVINCKIVERISTKYLKIPNVEEIREVNAFEWVVDQISEYIVDKEEKIIAGLTFSYPIEQTSIDSGKILNLAKNFHFKAISGTVDPVIALNNTFKKRGYNITIKALANDTVATLMSLQPLEDEHRIGIVLGTGTNASYFKPDFDGHFKAVNLEWSSFDCKELRKNIYDEKFEDLLKSQGNSTVILDRLVGGYGFLPLLNMLLKDMNLTTTDYTYQDVDEIIHQRDESSPIFKAIKSIKSRTMKVITALVLAIIESKHILPDETVSLIMNGTIFELPFDFELFETEILKFIGCVNLKPGQLRFVRPKDASLVGMVHILLSEILN